MAYIFRVKIGGTDFSEYFKWLESEPTGDATVGSARIVLDAQAGGLTIEPLMPVEVWRTYNDAGAGIAAKGRLFQGLVKIRDTGNVGTTKVWNVDCWDNNAILKLTVRDAQSAKAVHLTAGTFAAQVASLVEIIQENGYGTVNSFIDATTGVVDFYASMPEVTYPGGHDLDWYIRQLCITAQAYNSTGGAITGTPTIVQGGTGYPTSPTVVIDPPPAGGTQATATAHATAGVVDTVTIVNPGQGYTTPPGVEILGGGLVNAVVTVAVTAVSYPLRPVYFMGVAQTFGALEAFGGPVLYIYDGAAMPTPTVSFSDVAAGGRIVPLGEFRRVTDASMPIVQRQQSVFGLGAIVTSQDATSQSTYPYPYINHGGASNTGYVMLPAIEDTTSTTTQEAQAALDKVIQAKAYPRDTYTFETEERILPGETIGMGWALEGIPDDTVFRVAQVSLYIQAPDTIVSTLTVNTRRLGLFDDGSDIFAPPIEGDGIPPLPPEGFALTSNTYNVVTGQTDLVFDIDPSLSPDAIGYKIQDVATEVMYDVAGELAPSLAFPPGQTYTFRVYAYDRAGNMSTSADDTVDVTTAPAPHLSFPNPSFEFVDPDDPTQAAFWTKDTSGSTGTVTRIAGGVSGQWALQMVHGSAGAMVITDLFPRGNTDSDYGILSFWGEANMSADLIVHMTAYDEDGNPTGDTTSGVTLTTGYSQKSIRFRLVGDGPQINFDFATNTAGATYVLDAFAYSREIITDEYKDTSVTYAKLGSDVTSLLASTYNTLIDTKGDLLVGTADDTLAKFPAGINGQISVADSAVTNGLRYVWPGSVALLTNKSGGSVAVGDLVIVDASNDRSFTTTNTANLATRYIGVAQETIANNAIGAVTLSGYVPQINLTGAATRGQYVFTSTTVKQGVASSTLAAGAFGQVISAGSTPSIMLWGQPLNAQAPAAHASTHVTGGTDVIANVVAGGNSGLMTGTDKTKLDNAVSANTASRLVIRDASARAQFADPSAAQDAATKNYADTNFGSKALVDFNNSAPVTKTSTFTADATTKEYICNSISAFTANLPAASGCSGREYIFKQINTGKVTIDANSSETIDGITTFPLLEKYQSVNIRSNGTNWEITGQSGLVLESDGTRWLGPPVSQSLFNSQNAGGVGTTYTGTTLIGRWGPISADVWMPVTIVWSGATLTTLNSSNYWTLRMGTENAGGGGAVQCDISSYASGRVAGQNYAMTGSSFANTPYDFDSTNAFDVFLEVRKDVGAPGNFLLYGVNMIWRRVYT